MRLYESTIPSGNVYKVELLLAQLGLSAERVALDILATPSQTRLPEFLAKNSNGRVPLLELDDGRCLPESNAILCYLAEGTRFLPSERFERARTLQWLFFEQYSHEPYVAVLKFWTYWGGLDKCRSEDVERWKTRGQAALEVMEVELRERPFFVGGQYTIADIALYAYTQSAEAVGFRLGDATKAWLQRISEQPGHFPIRAPQTS